MRKEFNLILALMVALFAGTLKSYGQKKDRDAFLEVRLSDKNPFVDERIMYEVVLVTNDPNVAGTELVRNPEMEDFTAKRASRDQRLAVSEKHGKNYYEVVIDRVYARGKTSGNHVIKGGEYRVGFNIKQLYSDPFWGNYYDNKVEIETLASPDVKVKVSALPSKNKPSDFSGAIGDFKIQPRLPEGNIYSGEEAVIYFVITGDGDLSETALPDVKSAFGKGLTLRSVSEEHKNYITKGVPQSQLEIECIFVPETEGDFEIGKINFEFFNPKTGKYTSVESSPVKIEVVNMLTKRTKPSKSYDI